MLRRLWRWLVGEPALSSQDRLILEVITALREQGVEQQRTLQLWLGMFQQQAGVKPQGWTADEEAVAIKEAAAERGLQLPEEFQDPQVSEQSRIAWLEKQMESDAGW